MKKDFATGRVKLIYLSLKYNTDKTTKLSLINVFENTLDV